MKNVLILGATGAMGTYLTEKLSKAGHQVDAVSLDRMESKLPNLHYIQVKDARDPATVRELTQRHYDAIVDFMIYNSISFRQNSPFFMEAADQYVYLSSCRVYANEANPIVESSPRLLDVTTDRQLLFSDDYCMHKARGEDFLRASKYRNWTIVRPSTTYSKKRCQLLTLERGKILECLHAGKPALLSEPARKIPASLTWGSDVADMIAGLLFQEKTLCEDYNVTSSECRTWEEIAGYYADLFGLKYEWVSEDEYQRFRDPGFDPEKSLAAVWQLKYARMFNRVYDNSKMLAATGLKQENFLSLYDGLKHERETILAED